MENTVNPTELLEITRELLSVGGRHGTLESNPGMKEQVIRLISLLRTAMYPHVFGGTEDHTAIAVEYRLQTARRLLEQLLDTCRPGVDNASAALRFLRALPGMKAYLETDIQAAYDGDPAAMSTEEIMLAYPAFEAISIYRMAHELYAMKIPMLPRMMTEYAHQITGIDIHPGATIGKYFFIDHGTGIVIGETTEIGNNVKIYQGVTLGALSTRGGQNLRGKKRHPTICDNVTIYSGASILGGETVVGKNVVVGGNAFITTSIPEGAKVSVKSQELMYNYDSKHPVERKDVELDDAWFYVI